MEKKSSERRFRRQVRWFLAVLGLVLVVSLFFKYNRLTTNPRSRIITVQRIVDNDTWSHATPGDTTPMELSIDAVKVGDRLYSSKPPLYPALMAAQSLAVHKVTGMPFYEKRTDYLRMLVLVNQILPYLLMLWMAFGFLKRHTTDRWTIWFVLLALGPGMLAFGYATTINNHTPAALLYTMTFFMVQYMVATKSREGWRFALVGLMAGFAVSIELPSGGMALWTLALLAMCDWKKSLLALPFFVLPIVLSLWFYHYLSGDWRPFYLRSGLYKYEGSYWNAMESIDSVRPGKGEYLFHMLIGFRGLFSMTPVLLLGLVGMFRDVLWRRNWLWKELGGYVPGILALLVFVLFNTWNYGGHCIGMRWFICFSPLLLLMGVPLITELGRSRWGRWGAMLLLGWGMVWNVQALMEEAFILGWFEQFWA